MLRKKFLFLSTFIFSTFFNTLADDVNIDRYSIGTGTDSFFVEVEKIESCGMEKQPGLQVWYTHNVKSGYGFCQNNTSYQIMLMNRDNIKEMPVKECTYETPDKKSWFKAFVVNNSGTYKVKLSTKIKSSTTPKETVYELPFAFVEYKNRMPAVIQVAKELYGKDEIDQFKIEDIAQERFLVQVSNTTSGMDKKPALNVKVSHNGQSDASSNLYVTADMVKNAKNGVIAEKTYENKVWGPGKQGFKVTTSGKKLKLSIATKTAAIPVEREYTLPF